MGLYAQQAYNRRMTALLIGAFVLLLAALGGLIDLYLQSQGPGFPFTPICTVGALGISLVSGLISYYQGDKMVLSSMRARPLDLKRYEEKQLQNVVEEMSLASGIPMPKLFILPDADPNAFATGRSPEHASLGVTEGLLELLDREELQAVVAHEMGHIANLDIRTMMIVSVLLGAVGLLADLVMQAGRSDSRRSDRKSGSGNLVLVLVAMGAAMVGRMLAMAVSRTREFEADRTAAEFTRNPLALARALAKVEGHTTPTKLATQGTAHMFIVDPRVSNLNDRSDWMGDLFASHPPMRVRIERLEAMGYGRVERTGA